MCVTCGCGSAEVHIDSVSAAPAQAQTHFHTHADGTSHSHSPAQTHDHDHDHDVVAAANPTHGLAAESSHSHSPGTSATRRVQIEQDILAKNNAYAQANRQALADGGVFALNLVSSPGSGKTTLLCESIQRLGAAQVVVIEGDQQTSLDADRIRATGATAIQINTGKGCHLDAHMVGHALDQLTLAQGSLLMIENVGNLVCPAAFDLGEAHKVVILSVTEGEDKPLKYPDMFRAASVMLLNKIDLLPYLSYDLQAALDDARRVNPALKVIQISATTGQGMPAWLDYLREGMAGAAAARQQTVQALKARVAELEAQLAAQPGA